MITNAKAFRGEGFLFGFIGWFVPSSFEDLIQRGAVNILVTPLHEGNFGVILNTLVKLLSLETRSKYCLCWI